jgi:hypothetical protein
MDCRTSIERRVNMKNKDEVGFDIDKTQTSMYVKNRDVVSKFQVEISTAVSKFLAESGLYPETISISYRRNKDDGKVMVGADILMR